MTDIDKLDSICNNIRRRSLKAIILESVLQLRDGLLRKGYRHN